MRTLLVGLAVLLASATAQAGVVVQVEVRGQISDNYAIFEPFAGAPIGTEMALSFRLDSGVYVDGRSGRLRGYVIDTSSFELSGWHQSVPIDEQLPPHQPLFFVIEEGAAGRDSFRLSLDLERVTGAPVEMPAAYQFSQDCKFELQLRDGAVPSVALLDDLGAYSSEGSTGSHWVLNDGGFEPVTMRFRSLRLTVAEGGFNDEGSALPGAAGRPRLEGEGELAAGQRYALHLTGAAPQAHALLYLSTTAAPAHFMGGTLLPGPILRVVAGVTDAHGSLHVSGTLPPHLPPHSQLWLQWAIADAGAPLGVALSNALRGVPE